MITISNRFVRLVVASALLYLVTACGGDEVGEGPFQQVDVPDGVGLDLVGPGPVDVPGADHVGLEDAQPDGKPGEVEPPDIAPDMGPPTDTDAPSPSDGDGGPTDTGPTDIGPGDGIEDTVPDEGSPPDDCATDADCMIDPVALPSCKTMMCYEGQCVMVPAKSGSPCDAIAEEVAADCAIGVCDAAGDCITKIQPGATCEDQNPCTTDESCQNDGTCSGGLPVICQPGGPCESAICDATSGGCVTYPSTTGLPCEDGDPCTEGTQCADGACGGGDNVCSCLNDSECPDDGDLCNGVSSCTDLPEGGKGCAIDPDSLISCPPSGDPCLSVGCDGETGTCTTTPLPGTPCDDGDPCTHDDLCNDQGQCAGTFVLCEDEDPCTLDQCDAEGKGCLYIATSGSPCFDGDLCTTADICVDGLCTGTPKLCDDGNQCTFSTCNPDTGKCKAIVNGGAPCDDGNACTDGETCSPTSGVCLGEAIPCTDGNPCTSDGCDALTGCVFDPVPLPCDDEDACTSPDVCADSACQGGVVDCDDGVDCTVDSCDTQDGCENVPDDGACDDGNACTADVCDSVAGCINTPLSEGDCDDGDACTGGDVCSGGACVGAAVDCDDGFGCTQDGCDPATGCTHSPSDEPCDDDNPCTDDGCTVTGGCQYTHNNVGCEDGNVCTDGDICIGGFCAPGSNACACIPQPAVDVYWNAEDDGDGKAEWEALFVETFNSLNADQELLFQSNGARFTGSYTQPYGQALAFELPVPTDLANPQLAYHLSGTSIEQSAVFLFWEDASGAYHDIRCVDAGASGLVPGAGGWSYDQNEIDLLPYACADTSVNYNWTGSVVFAPGAAPVTVHLVMLILAVPNGDNLYVHSLGFPDAVQVSEECDDGDLCNGIFSCEADGNGGGTCTQVGDPVGCNEPVAGPCLVSGCDPSTGQCGPVPVADGTLCADADPCTVDEVCLAGTCIPAAVNCDDGVPCTVDQCDSDGGGCIHTPLDALCNDFVPCTVNTCHPVDGCIYTPGAAGCDDGFPCTDDACDPVTGCSHTPNDQSCDDGFGCTVDTCSANLGCVHEALPSTCDDQNPCTDDTCDLAAGCTHGSTTKPCDDGNPCTVADTCDGGVCQPGDPVICDDENACTVGSCEPATGGCGFAPLEDGTACEDGNVCTNPDTCGAGLCLSGPPEPCDDGLGCTLDSCDALDGCIHGPVDALCQDGNPCTDDVCEPGVGCYSATVADFGTCDDGLFGTSSDVCVGGVCHGFQTTTILFEQSWWCQVTSSLAGAIDDLDGNFFAIVSYTVDGLFCAGDRSQVVLLEGGDAPTTVGSSAINGTLTGISHDLVVGDGGQVGQLINQGASVNYFFNDVLTAIQDKGLDDGTYTDVWASPLADVDGAPYETRYYLVGLDGAGNKGQINRCTRDGDGVVTCKKLTSGIGNGQQKAMGPAAVDGHVSLDPLCDDCVEEFDGVSLATNDTSGVGGAVVGSDEDKFSVHLSGTSSTLYAVLHEGEDDVWVAGSEGHLAHFAGEDDGWTVYEGPQDMKGLELRALARAGDHLVVVGYWSGVAGSEAYLFALPAGADPADEANWQVVSLGTNREVYGVHATEAALYVTGRQAATGDEDIPTAYVWYLPF